MSESILPCPQQRTGTDTPTPTPGEIRAALDAIGATPAAPGVWLARLSTGHLIRITVTLPRGGAR